MGGDDDDPRAGKLQGLQLWARGCRSRALPARFGLRLSRRVRLRPLPEPGHPSLAPGIFLPAQLSSAAGPPAQAGVRRLGSRSVACSALAGWLLTREVSPWR